MNNEKGQALVEFVIILPILIFIILAIIDFGNIMVKKNALQNDLDIVSEMYVSEPSKIDSYLEKIDASVDYEYDGDYLTIILKKGVNIITPGLNLIYGSDYQINTSKTIYVGDSDA